MWSISILNLYPILFYLGAAFWIWMLYDCLTNEPSEGNDKLVWALVIIFTNIVGAFIYYFARRQNRIRTLGR